MNYLRLLLTCTFLAIASQFAFGQNAYFEAVRLNEAYKARDYKAFFQLLADQPDVKQSFTLRKGEAIGYADLYGYYAATAFLKPSLDTMMSMKNRELSNARESVASLQVAKTQTLSQLDNSLQVEIDDYVERRNQLEEIRNDLRTRDFKTLDPYRQLKLAIEATILKVIRATVDENEGLKLTVGEEMTGLEFTEPYTYPEVSSPFFAQLKPAFMALLNKQIKLHTIAAQKIQVPKEKLATPPSKTLDAFTTQTRIDIRPYLKVFPADSLKAQERRLIKLNLQLQKAEKQLKYDKPFCMV